MAVLNFREVVPRTFSHRFGEAPTAQMKFVATLDGPTATQAVLDAIGIYHGAAHPEYAYLLCTSGDLTETDRWHAEVTYTFAVPSVGTEDYDVNPLARPDVWSFSTGGAQVPALTCFTGSNNAVAPLTNSAGVFFENVTRPEAEIRATISGNRATFDYALAASVTNCINNAAYLGGAPYTWLCSGITGQQQIEVVNGVQVKYWSFVTELIYRRSTHLMYLPDIGFEYLENGAAGQGADAGDAAPQNPPVQPGVQIIPIRNVRTTSGSPKLKRAWVEFEGENGAIERIASASPVALNPDGSMKPAGQPPNLVVCRLNPVINFQQYFGTPPA